MEVKDYDLISLIRRVAAGETTEEDAEVLAVLLRLIGLLDQAQHRGMEVQ